MSLLKWSAPLLEFVNHALPGDVGPFQTRASLAPGLLVIHPTVWPSYVALATDLTIV
jgi:hypothetical protein